MPRLRLAPIGLSIFLAGCVSAGPSASPPAPPPTPSPTPAIAHATGQTNVILRMSTGGGFVAPGALLTEIPEFSLYGDGTVIYRDPATSYSASPRPDGIEIRVPFQSAHLSETQVQAILADAMGPGGLAAAADNYPPCCVADAPSTIFTLSAGGLDKVVTVGALGFNEPQASPDDGSRAAFAALATRLVAPDVGSAAVSDYQPTAYRGILMEGQIDPSSSAAQRPWPWTDFGPADFSPSGPTGLPVPTRTLTSDDVAVLKIGGLEGGATGIALKSGDGKVYLLSLRPLLPDEKS